MEVRNPRRAARWALLAVLTAGLLASFFYHPSGPPICGSKLLFNVACPGCGMTRSVTACAQGRFLESVRFHAFGPVALAVLVVLWAGHAWTLACGREWDWPRSRGMEVAAGALLVLLLGYWALRAAAGALP